VIASVLLVLVVALSIYWFYPRPQTQGVTDPFPIPPLSVSPYLNTKPDVAYVGSEACRHCHPNEHASFRRTGMGRSAAAIDPNQLPPDANFDHPVSKRRYQVHRQDDRLWHRESLLTGGTSAIVLNDVPLTHVVGSGTHAHTFLAEIDGFLVESPITWYTSRKAWAMSPGFDRAEHAGFQRPVNETCLFCHTGRFEVIAHSDHRSKITEPAISCERCHGPGQLHVQHHSSKQSARRVDAGGDETIVNPSRLPRALAEAVCQQCHLQASALVPARGRKPSDYRPGLALEEFRHDYRLEVDNVPVKVVGHVEQLRLSRCYQASSMTCVTCHDPHHEPELAQRDQHYQAVCVSCHKPAQCRVDTQVRKKQSPGNRCIQCHMPQATTEVEHVAFTHHRIGKQFESPQASSQQAGDLRPVLTLPTLTEVDRKRSLGLGYLEAANRSSDQSASRGYAQKALDLLSTVRDAGLRDSLVDAGLADAHSLLHLDATKYAEAALAHPDLPARERCTVMLQYAQMLAKQSRLDEAVATLHELQKLRRMAVDSLTLADCERAQGNTAESIAAFEQAVRINPRLWKVHRMLAEHYRRLGNNEKAAWHEARAVP
jgi:hypothetical protein